MRRLAPTHRTSSVGRAACAAVLLLGGTLSACTGGGPGGGASTSSTPTAGSPAGSTVTSTRSPSAPVGTFTPAAATTVAPLPPGRPAHAGEVDKACPYIRSGPSQTAGGADTLADIEGDHVYRTTVLTRYSPVGCRFYFYAPPYEAIADILPRRFGSATEAHNALVLTARQGSEAIGVPDFVPGVDGISYRTRFFGDDGDRDWAFAFAKGRLLVVVHTQRSDTSVNARYIAAAIVGKF